MRLRALEPGYGLSELKPRKHRFQQLKCSFGGLSFLICKISMAAEREMEKEMVLRNIKEVKSVMLEWNDPKMAPRLRFLSLIFNLQRVASFVC